MKEKYDAYLKLSLIVLLTLALTIIVYAHEIKINPMSKEAFEERNFQKFLEFRTLTNPDIEDRKFIGDESAPITVVVYLDFTGESTKLFTKETLPWLLQEYRGKIKIYPKYAVSHLDIEEKTENYMHSILYDCYIARDQDPLEGLLKITQYANYQENLKMIVFSSIERRALKECVRSGPSSNILRDVSEIEKFGLVGVSPQILLGIQGSGTTILRGVPRKSLLQRRLREYETRVGS